MKTRENRDIGMIRKIRSYFKRNKTVLLFVLFGMIYIFAFYLLENRDVQVNIIHTVLDDRIPFCEYFIIPYLAWFVYVAVVSYYFIFVCKDHKERDKLIYSLCTGMFVFLVVSVIYPNGHNLRPELVGNEFCIELVKVLYRLDTATNILPSLHVFCTIVCSIALVRQEELRKKKGFVAGIVILSMLIVLSTMFLKQHSIVDVMSAMLLNVGCYLLFYKKNIHRCEQ